MQAAGPGAIRSEKRLYKFDFIDGLNAPATASQARRFWRPRHQAIGIYVKQTSK
jgi:hypothetical protein